MRVIESIISDGHGWLDPSYIVIHETANPGATAANHRDYWSRDDTYAVHYVGDWTGDVYHCVPDDRLCWQVGNGNPYVLGIELCHADNPGDFERVWQVGVEWAAWALSGRGWGVDRLLSHYDCTRRWGGSDHTDPIGYFEEFGRSWEQFVGDVAAYMSNGGAKRKVDDLRPVKNDGGELHRLYNAGLGTHMYALPDEAASLAAAGWADEGAICTMPRGGTVAIYRLYNAGLSEHMFTASYDEARALVDAAGWEYEGVPFFAAESGKPVYRLYNPQLSEHLFTASESERDELSGRHGWQFEGVAWRV